MAVGDATAATIWLRDTVEVIGAPGLFWKLFSDCNGGFLAGCSGIQWAAWGAQSALSLSQRR